MGCIDKFGLVSTSINQINIALERSTVDAEPTVRCKDCRYYEAENHNCLDEMRYARIWNEDDYCSFAERREDANE